MDTIIIGKNQEVYSTQIPETKKSQEFDLSNINKKYQPRIKAFHTILKESVSPECLNTFYDRITTSTITYSKLKNFLYRFCYIKVTGEYLVKENEIHLYVNRGQRTTLTHELLHLSSSYVNQKREHYQIGFYQENPTLVLGDALNECYTEYLTNKLFHLGYNSSDYIYESIIAMLVEEVLGDQTMQKLYFTGDLYNFINNLCQYTTIDNVKKFLFLTDYVLNNRYKITRKKASIESISYINQFLLEVYTNKLIKLYQEKEITLLEVYQLLEIFTYELKQLLDINLPMKKEHLKENIVKNKQLVMYNIKQRL